MSSNTDNTVTTTIVTPTKSFTFEEIVQLKPQFVEAGKKYVSLVGNANRKIYKPEFDNIFILKANEKFEDDLSTLQKQHNLGRRIAVVDVSLIETVLKPMTFTLSYYVFEFGFVWPTSFNTDMGRANCYKPIVEDVIDKATNPS